MRRASLRLLWLGLAGACFGAALVPAAGSVQPRGTHLSAQERAACEARRGRVMIAGLSGSEMCALPFADGGRRCTDGSQCAGDCLYEGRTPSRRDARVAGVCERYRYGFGCRSFVEHGRITRNLCVD